MSLLLLLDLLGVAVFAVSGALAAGRRRMDIFGVVVLATVTAVGGGTLRDLLLGSSPVFWVRQPVYLLVAAGAGIFTFFAAHRRTIDGTLLNWADALGLSLFAVTGAQLSARVSDSPLIIILMGVVTATAGGVIRDVLANRVPLIFRSDLYATAALCGAGTWYLLVALAVPVEMALFGGGAITLALRLGAMRWHWSLPVFPDRQ